MPIVENLLESIGHFLIKRARQSRKRKSLPKKAKRKAVRKSKSPPSKKKIPSRKKKTASRKKPPAKKAVKAAPPKRKASFRKKTPSRKAAPVRKKAVPKRAAKPARKPAVSGKKAPLKSVEKPAGEITHFFDRISVCVVKAAGPLKVGDRIRVKGRDTDFTQAIQSMQIESVDVKAARKGQLVGLKTARPARVGDRIYRI